MAGPLSSIPVSALKPSGALDDVDQKYSAEIEKLRAALEAREANNTQQMLLAMSAGFLTPGPTGAFGESLGHAAGNVAKVQREQEGSALEGAKMRLQLAQSEKEQGNRNKAIQMASRAMGLTPSEFSQGIQSGNVPLGSFSRVNPAVFAAVEMADRKIGAMMKSVHEMDIKNAQLAIDLYKAGVSRGELVAKFGPEVVNLLPEAPFQQTTGAPKTETTTTETPKAEPAPIAEAPKPTQTVEVPANLPKDKQDQFRIVAGELQVTEDKLSKTTDPTERAKLQRDADALKREMSAIVQTKPTTVAQAKPAEDDDLQGLPLETKNAIRKKRTEDMEAPFSEKRKNIYTFDPQTLSSQDARLRETYSTVQAHPDVVGLMVRQGFLSALGAAMQKGAQTPWGTFSLPVTEFVSKLNLPPEKQVIATRIGQLMAEQFFDNARTNKSLLGPQISNADVMLLRAPVATPEDSAASIQYWIKHQILGNKLKSDLYNSLIEFDRSRGAKANPADYFNPKRNLEYGNIVNKYGVLTNQLVQEHSPAFMSGRK